MNRVRDSAESASVVVVRSVNVGRVTVLRHPSRDVASGIDKHGVEGRVRVGRLGLHGDEQGDLRAHGGPEKAVHHYPYEHYPLWTAWMADAAAADPGTARGVECALMDENISTVGLTEAEVFVGDVFALGSARVQVSQGRQPCWKLDARLRRRRLEDWSPRLGE